MCVCYQGINFYWIFVLNIFVKYCKYAGAEHSKREHGGNVVLYHADAPRRSISTAWLMATISTAYTQLCKFPNALQWRHNDHGGVSNHQPHGCLLNRLFRRRSKKTSKLRVTGTWGWKFTGTGEFPAQRASYAENFSIWWRHHGIPVELIKLDLSTKCLIQSAHLASDSYRWNQISLTGVKMVTSHRSTNFLVVRSNAMYICYNWKKNIFPFYCPEMYISMLQLVWKFLGHTVFFNAQ